MKLVILGLLLASSTVFASSRTQTCEELVGLTRTRYATLIYNMKDRIANLEIDGVAADERDLYNSLVEKVRLATAMDAEESEAQIDRCESVN